MNKGSYEEWCELGKEVKQIRESILNTVEGKQHLLTKAEIKYLIKAVDNVDSFRCAAEARMLEIVNPPAKENEKWLSVFYGEM